MYVEPTCADDLMEFCVRHIIDQRAFVAAVAQYDCDCCKLSEDISFTSAAVKSLCFCATSAFACEQVGCLVVSDNLVEV